jgi:predicted NBD/HSP70 family sugar kinase
MSAEGVNQPVKDVSAEVDDASLAAASGSSPVNPRQDAVERLLDSRQQAARLTEGQWASLTAHVVDAALSSDDGTLEVAFTGLQWMAADLRRQERNGGGDDPESAFEQGRTRGVLDIARWHLRRSVTAAAPSIPRGGLVARMLLEIASWPGRRNHELGVRLGVDETQISRAGRHLRGSGLATVQRVGRENAWFVTPRGASCLRLMGLQVEPHIEVADQVPVSEAAEPGAQGAGELGAARPAEAVPEHVAEDAVPVVLSNILGREPHDQHTVQEETGLPEVTVAQAVDFLVNRGYVVREPQRPGGPALLRVNEGQYRAIGISIGLDNVVGVLANLRARDIRHITRHLDTSRVDDVVQAIREISDQLLSPNSAQRNDVIGLGVNLPGHVDPRRGVVVWSPLGPGEEWNDVPLARQVQAETGLPVTVENDVNSLALHEKYFGEGQGVVDFAVVFVTPDGEGVGSGLVVDGTLVHGSTGSAGEIGHAPLGDEARLCRCSNYGCLEAVVAFSAMRDKFAETGRTAPASLAEAAEWVADGDPFATQVFAEAGSAFGSGVATVLSMLDPDMAVLSGPTELIDIDGTVPSAAAFTGAARSRISRHAFGRSGMHTRIVTKQLTGAYAAQGAAAALLLRTLYEPREIPVAMPMPRGELAPAAG